MMGLLISGSHEKVFYEVIFDTYGNVLKLPLYDNSALHVILHQQSANHTLSSTPKQP